LSDGADCARVVPESSDIRLLRWPTADRARDR